MKTMLYAMQQAGLVTLEMLQRWHRQEIIEQEKERKAMALRFERLQRLMKTKQSLAGETDEHIRLVQTSAA